MERETWIQGFVFALEQWEGARDFIDNGGVPGCSVPESVSFRRLAEWWLEPVTNGSHMDAVYGRVGDDPRVEITEPLNLEPRYAVEILMNDDITYSPDY